MWYHSEAQRTALAAVMKELEGKYRVRLATTVDPAGDWWDAEEYHQKCGCGRVRGMGGVCA